MTHINTQFAVDVTVQPQYYTRQTDEFEANGDKLDPKIYQAVYARDFTQILPKSFHTRISVVVKDLCRRYVQQVMASPFLDGFSLLLNTYPFRLNEEQTFQVKEMLTKMLGQGLETEVVYLDLKELTIREAKSRFVAMIMYEWYTWLNMHNTELVSTQMRDVGLYVPRLFFQGDKMREIDDDTKRMLSKRNMDHFEAYAEFLDRYLNVQFLPVGFFSADTPVNAAQMDNLVKVA